MTRLRVGDPAPAFSLSNHDGHVVRSADLLGERYVLYFYPADDTPGCTRESCQFNDELAAFGERGTRVLGVSPDGLASHVAFRHKYDLRLELLSDPTHETMAAYGAYGEKLNYGKTIIGVIRSTVVVGADGTIEHAWYAVKTDGHARRVLAALR
jgi:peroxiredoxin Q/BCP